MKIIITKQEAIDGWLASLDYYFREDVKIEIEDDFLEVVNIDQISGNSFSIKEMPNAVPLPHIQNIC